MNNSIPQKYREKIGLIIQARLGSTRLPQKVLRPVLNKEPMILHLVNRLKRCGYPLYLAVPSGEAKHFSFLENDIILFEGNEDDVLSRYYECAKRFDIQTVVRATADNPLASEFCLQYGLEKHFESNAEISFVKDIPYGAGVENICFEALEKMHFFAKEKDEREHATTYAYRREKEFHIERFEAPEGYKNSLRVTVDTLEDFLRYEKWVQDFGLEKEGYLSLEKVLCSLF